MGDSERWPKASGLSPEGILSFSAAWDSILSKGDEWWAKAELRVAELITSIQPNPSSELRRQTVVDHVTKLIQSCVKCEVMKFGSVPLKTYLPDGDIDLTVCSPSPEAKRSWIQDVYNVFQKEKEKEKPNSEFWVKEVQLVQAEVKIVKCYVGNILVDVSFDQLGGMGTLCFLEEVDRLIGDDNLFKRSIILVKAWCYYESRLLGAHCGLMSTYALETLVLYIFHVFHASLRGPLQVLYLFLEFFSSFDWDKYCVSLSGPILLASFSEESTGLSIVAEDLQKLAFLPRREGAELYFTKAYLGAWETNYGFVPLSQNSKSNKFAVKFLNILDPLRRTNNLGRSVNQGTCARIRRAFDLGARTLRSILKGSEADVPTELNQFFKNCKLRYHGSNQRPDVAVPGPCQTKVSNVGAAKRDVGKTERNNDVSHSSPSQNGYHLQETWANHSLPVENTYPDAREPPFRKASQVALGYGVEGEGAPIPWSQSCASSVELPSGREENIKESAGSLKFIPGEEVGSNSGDQKIVFNNRNSNGLISYSPHVDEERMIPGDESLFKRIPSQFCSLEIVNDRLPGASGMYEEDELSAGMLSEALRIGSNHESRGELEKRHALVANMDLAGASKQRTTENGYQGSHQHRTNSSASSTCSKVDSEEEEECSSQSSSKENFESTRSGSSSLTQGRPHDPQHSTSNFAAQTEVPTPLYSKQSVSVRNEEGRNFSVPVEIFKQTGNDSEYPGVAEGTQIKVPRRKGRAHLQHGLQSKDFEGSGTVHGKSRRSSGKSKGTWAFDDGREKIQGREGIVSQDGGISQVGTSTTGGSSCAPQSPVPASGYQHVHLPRHSPTDASAGGHFKTSQSRPYQNAGRISVPRHPLANCQFDLGTVRMAAGSSAPSRSSAHQYPMSYNSGYADPSSFPPGFSQSSMFSPGNYNRDASVKGDGPSGINVKNRTGQEANGSSDVPIEYSGDCPSNNGESTMSKQIAVADGNVERLDAEGILASTKRSCTVAARNTSGAEPSGSSSEFLTGDLQFHLKSLAFGRYCDFACNPSQVVYPAYGPEQHAYNHSSWEGHGRPDPAVRAQYLAPQLYPSAPGWFTLFHQASYFQYHQSLWGTRGVELTPRPRGTGTYLPYTQLRQNSRGPGRGRGVGQNGSLQQEDKYHQSREHENNTHHLHGPHYRAPMNKDEAHHAQVHGSSNRVVENRSVKTDRVRDPHQPEHEFAKTAAPHSHPSESSVSSLRANPGEVLHPCELLLRTDCDLSVPLDVRKTSSGPPIVTHSGLSESNLSSELLSVEFLFSGESLPDGRKRSGQQLKRSASLGHSYELVKYDDLAAVSGFPTTIGEVIPTATTQRKVRQTYHMKDEDFPPLGGRRVNRAQMATNGTGSKLGSYVSL